MSDLIYLYIYQHRESGKAYIGVTKEPKCRFHKHAVGKSAARAFNYAVKKYGIESFDQRILAVFDDVDAANYHENAAIAAFGTLSPNGYNLIGGAPRSQYFGCHSEETKRKIGIANRKNVLSPEHIAVMLNARKGIQNHNKGKKLTPEHREKLSTAHKGKPLSDEHRQNMIASIKRTWEEKSPEEIIDYSQKIKKQWENLTPEQREKHSKNTSAGLKGKVLSEETRRKISEAAKAQWNSPGFRERYSRIRTGQKIKSGKEAKNNNV